MNILSIVVAVLVLLVMITVHEFGHYLSGKILGFKINEFSIGFGPKLFSKKSKKSGELFAIRAIPLGGYCSFAGEDELEEERKRKAEQIDPFEEESETSSTSEKEGETLSGGEILPDSENKNGKKRGKKSEKSPDGGKKSEKQGKEKKLFNEQACWKRIIVLVSGALMNYVLALIVIIISFGVYGQLFLGAVEVAPVEDGSISQEHVLCDRDIFFEVEGKDIYLSTDILKALNGKKKGDLANFRISRVVGEGRETMDVQIEMRTDCDFKNSADTDSLWQALGIAAEYDPETDAVSYKIGSATVHFGFFETIGRSFMYSFHIAGVIFRVIGELFSASLGLDALGGPVSTITVTSQLVFMSPQAFLEIVALIGVNLAVFNLLPIPALDGSKVVFTLIEWIFRKPVPRKVEAIIHLVGMILIFAFAIMVDVFYFMR